MQNHGTRGQQRASRTIPEARGSMAKDRESGEILSMAFSDNTPLSHHSSFFVTLSMHEYITEVFSMTVARSECRFRLEEMGWILI